MNTYNFWQIGRFPINIYQSVLFLFQQQRADILQFLTDHLKKHKYKMPRTKFVYDFYSENYNILIFYWKLLNTCIREERERLCEGVRRLNNKKMVNIP